MLSHTSNVLMLCISQLRYCLIYHFIPYLLFLLHDNNVNKVFVYSTVYNVERTLNNDVLTKMLFSHSRKAARLLKIQCIFTLQNHRLTWKKSPIHIISSTSLRYCRKYQHAVYVIVYVHGIPYLYINLCVCDCV